METEIVKDYIDGMDIYSLCEKYHFGKLKIKKILSENGVELRKRGGQKKNKPYVIDDWKKEKYPLEDGYYYEAQSKDGKFVTKDYMNNGGKLTSYINDNYDVEIPTLYDRREYYKLNGNYWWEQWFNIEIPSLYKRKKYFKENNIQWYEQWFDIVLEKDEKKETKKCPYCDWETVDIENKSGVFEQHLMTVHNKTVEDYLSDYPSDIDYFPNFKKKKEKELLLNDEYNYVVCPICGKKFPKITYSHVHLKHNMSITEFKRKYPNYRIMSDGAIEQIRHEQLSANLVVSKKRFVSKYERELQEWLTSNSIEFECNRQILIGKEIDILIPSLRIGIEFDGLKWHTENFGRKDRNYHVDKTNRCNEQGYGLIHIFEDEYVNSKELVYKKLSHILHLDNNLPRIQGRKIEVGEIHMNDAKEFLDKYHIQGSSSSTVYLGGFYNGNLIAVMTFKHGNVKNPHWELTRFASNFNFAYQGVGGKLFSYFIKKYNPSVIVSFADRRWTISKDNNLYTRLGFELEQINKPDYRYYNCEEDKYKRIHKMAFNKKALHRKYGFPLTMTEKEMSVELGYDRIWDCGLFKYVWYSRGELISN